MDSSSDAKAHAAIHALQQLPPAEQLSDSARQSLATVLEKAKLDYQPPVMLFHSHLFSYQTLPVLRLSSAVGIFDAFADAEFASLALDELVPRTRGDVTLVRRLVRYLCGLGVLEETGLTIFKPREIAKLCTSKQPWSGSLAHFYNQMHVFSQILQYYREKDFQTSENAYDAPFQFAFDTKDHSVAYIAKHPDMQNAFNRAMSISSKFRGDPWVKYFPVAEKLGGQSGDRVLLVDIGGGTGTDACDFRAAHPDLPGRVVVQELPAVVAEMNKPLPGGVEAMEHDMFTPQPLRGAAAYYLRTVLHDWPDAQALEVLNRVHEAMAPDSLLLLNENIIPERGATLFSAQVDLIMMANYSSWERTERQWKALLDRAGFAIKGVWRPQSKGPGSNAILEASLKA